jgi:hypothetical protein
MAAGGTPGNVQLGPGRLYYAPLGTAEPTSASAAMPSAWQALGYTDTGTAFSSETTQEAVEVAEELDPLAYVGTRRASSFTVAMAETTKKRLELALGAGAGFADDAVAFEPPDPGARIATMFVWDSMDPPLDNTNRRWLFRSCMPSGAITMERRKAPAKSLFTVTFNLQKPAGLAPYKIFPNVNGLV